jgi:diguanylate cyclase (GGDEF)-like protein
VKSNRGSNTSSTILVVDDDAVILSTLAKVLFDQGYQVLIAKSGEKALEVMNTTQPHLLLLDINMPGMSGIDLCNIISSKKKWANIPLLFLTSSDAQVETAFDSGGVDYILKPFKLPELLARIETHLKMASLVDSLEHASQELAIANHSLEAKVKERTKELINANTNLRKEINERRHLQDRIEYVSKFDFVTRLLNKSSMEDLLEYRLKPHNNELTSFLAYLDIDQFKVINDTCGHVAGDELLRELAELIKNLIQDDDHLARMGGDEFALLFYSRSSSNALRKMSKLKAEIESFQFIWEEQNFQINISIGLVEIDDNFDGINHLISVSERTCFESKSKGGSEISLYHIKKYDIDRRKEQMRWVPIIQQALSEDDFFLCGQQLIDLSTNQCNKIEVLIRLRNPDESITPPGHFIPIAERYHLITAIDKWVLENTLKQKHLFDQGFQLSINLSGESINKPSVINYLTNILEQSNIDGQQICFEITETSAFTNIKATKDFMESISAYGCKFSLDDFGTGTSSYGYLKSLPIDFLKIDGLFIRDLEKEKINQMMVKSITDIAHEMGIKVIAECVETEVVLSLLKSFGVDFVQGFHLHRPTPLTNI